MAKRNPWTVSDLLLVVGFALIFSGLWFWSREAFLVVLGAGLVWLGTRAA